MYATILAGYDIVNIERCPFAAICCLLTVSGGKERAMVLLARPAEKQLEDNTHKWSMMPLSAVDDIIPLVLYIVFFFLQSIELNFVYSSFE